MAKRGSPQLALDIPNEVIGDVERELAREGECIVIGVDEVGRGPLAGPVTVAAVAIDPARLSIWDGINDSKKLKEQERDRWAEIVQRDALAVAVIDVPAEIIDRDNILWASIDGMRAAVDELREHFPAARGIIVLVDGKKPLRNTNPRQRTMVKGDSRSYAIACASVVAKVHRDRLMAELDALYPGYGLAKHKGYPTRTHLEALRELGATSIHRRSFRPVAEALARVQAELDNEENQKSGG